jgi:hypothetical protein
MQRSIFLGALGAATVASALPARAAADASDVRLTTATGTLFGTLLIPAGVAKPPVAIIIAGSGPTDRNGNSPGLHLDMYRKLAEALADRGIASLCYDKRGAGASALAAPPENAKRFEVEVDDAAGWIATLRSDARFSSVLAIGHSEGSLVGMLAAAHNPIDATVSLEGAGFPIGAILRKQLAPQLQPYPALGQRVEAIITSLEHGKTVALDADFPPGLQALFRPSVQPYLISWMKYDPRVAIQSLTCRITIIQGTHDVQVPIENGLALSAAKPSATYALIAGMTHVLTDDSGTTLAAQLSGAYADATRPLDADMIGAVVTAAKPPLGR